MKIVKVGAVGDLPSGNKSAYVERLLAQVFAMGLAPEPVPETKISRFTVTLSNESAQALSTMADAHGVSPATLCAQLLRALELRTERARQAEPTGTSTEGLVGLDQVRDILKSTTTQAWARARTGEIVFSQASTGSGKGRMIASLALTARRDLSADQAVLVCAPLAVTRQLIAEVVRLDAQAKVSLMLGRNNFVDPVLLEQWIEAMEAKGGEAMVAQLRAWMDSGGRPATEGTRLLAETVKGGEHLAWLVDDATSLCEEDLPLHQVVLDNDVSMENPAERAYKAMRVLEEADVVLPPIIFCSHTMLAADVRLRMLNPQAALLPERIGMLIVDEAHELEKSFSNVFSQSLHLAMVPRYAKRCGLRAPISGAIVDAAERLTEIILRMYRRDELPKIGPITSMPQIESSVRELMLAVSDMPRTKRDGDTEKGANRRALRRTAEILNAALTGHTVHLSVTPVQLRPVITAGRANLTAFFAALWDRVEGAVLTSATLYAPEINGSEPSGKYFRWILSVPQARATYLPPVRPDWVIDSVDLYEDYSGIAPDDTAAWHDQTAQRILAVQRQAKGGVLALCTSYHTVNALAGRLREQLDKDVDLIVQGPNKNAGLCAREMKQGARKGRKALWLGVGSAWTGIDLSDLDLAPEQDLVLTDLVIARIPMGVNHTLTHLRRKAASRGAGFMVETKECARVFAQGVGRLVRREGVRHRKLWVFDARLGDHRLTYASGVRHFLRDYRGGRGRQHDAPAAAAIGVVRHPELIEP